MHCHPVWLASAASPKRPGRPDRYTVCLRQQQQTDRAAYPMARRLTHAWLHSSHMLFLLESSLLPAGSLEQQERRERRREQARAKSRRQSVGGGKEGMNLQGVSLQAEVPLWAQVCHSGQSSRCTHGGVTSRHQHAWNQLAPYCSLRLQQLLTTWVWGSCRGCRWPRGELGPANPCGPPLCFGLLLSLACSWMLGKAG